MRRNLLSEVFKMKERTRTQEWWKYGELE